MLRNIKLSADEQTIACAKADAANTSLNREFRKWLEGFVAETDTAARVFFLDCDVLVDGLLASEPLKKQRAIQLIESSVGSGQGCVSYQVLHEFANVALKKFAQRFTPAACQQLMAAAIVPLYFEDLQHHQRIGNLQIANPFLGVANEL